MTLLSETDESSGRALRVLRLEASTDGKTVVMTEFDDRKAGVQRVVCLEITTAD